MKQINFIENKENNAAMLFIIEEAQEIILDFSQETWREL